MSILILCGIISGGIYYFRKNIFQEKVIEINTLEDSRDEKIIKLYDSFKRYLFNIEKKKEYLIEFCHKINKKSDEITFSCHCTFIFSTLKDIDKTINILIPLIDKEYNEKNREIIKNDLKSKFQEIKIPILSIIIYCYKLFSAEIISEENIKEFKNNFLNKKLKEEIISELKNLPSKQNLKNIKENVLDLLI